MRKEMLMKKRNMLLALLLLLLVLLVGCGQEAKEESARMQIYTRSRIRRGAR